MYAAQSDQVTFRYTEAADLDYVVALEADPNNSLYITPWTRQQHLSALAENDTAHLMIEARGGDIRVGFLILSGLTAGHDCIEFMRIVIGVKGKGFGRAAVQLVKRYAFEQLGAHRVWLDVKHFNTRASALYGSEGFVVDGTLRECLKGRDGYDSIVVMSILEEEYRHYLRKLNTLPRAETP